ncbi:unnamed protein product [Lepeophtheirus salmonis]|uniref:(salmon louse) hypothetical protein n=1 Tax=Lepeophtheirus salmonis TaxID=72036 RepID=A0A7R8CXW5_LEPSM|nr:unnamed protein product [Lepeophtheirus salmonis]CAF2965760.1 unnamed protein product [Lepeophtheirus salmonis]
MSPTGFGINLEILSSLVEESRSSIEYFARTIEKQLHYKKKKWSKLIMSAKKKQSNARASAMKTGCGAPSDPLVNDFSTKILAAGQVNVDVVAGIDSETSLQQLS